MRTSKHHVITSCKFKKGYLQYSYTSNAFLLNEHILPWMSHHLIAETPFINREEKDLHRRDDSLSRHLKHKNMLLQTFSLSNHHKSKNVKICKVIKAITAPLLSVSFFTTILISHYRHQCDPTVGN